MSHGNGRTHYQQWYQLVNIKSNLAYLGNDKLIFSLVELFLFFELTMEQLRGIVIEAITEV